MSGERLLLVEDDPDNVALLTLALREAGLDHEVTVAQDGQEALDILWGDGIRKPFHPRVVFLDLRMPRLDGFGALQRLRADPRTSLLPVVILTSSDNPADVARCLRLGANSYLKKPVDFQSFSETVCGAARYWLSLNVADAAEVSP